MPKRGVRAVEDHADRRRWRGRRRSRHSPCRSAAGDPATSGGSGQRRLSPPARHLEVRRHRRIAAARRRDRSRRSISTVSADQLHADPAAGIARHRDAEQAHARRTRGRGRIEYRDHRRHEGVVGLMRHGRGLGGVIVAGEAEHAAMLRGAGGIAVLQHVAGAVDARALAVPDAEHAVLACAGRELDLLRAPDGGRGELLVDRRAGTIDVVRRSRKLLALHELLVVAAERRAAIAGDEAAGVEPCARSRRICAIGSRTSAWQAGQEDAPFAAGRAASSVMVCSRMACLFQQCMVVRRTMQLIRAGSRQGRRRDHHQRAAATSGRPTPPRERRRRRRRRGPRRGQRSRSAADTAQARRAITNSSSLNHRPPCRRSVSRVTSR